MSIPASQIVSVIPSVIGAGGSALDMITLMLSTNTRVPIGQVLSFPDYASVVAYFGTGTNEEIYSAVYFNGFDNSSKKPGALLISQYPKNAVSAYLRGGSMAAVSLSTLQGYSGTLTLTIDGVTATTGTINLSGATSFSNAASLIQTALAAAFSPDPTCTYDSVSGGFVITSNTTGATSTITYATGSGAFDTHLKLTAAQGAVLSQGAAATDPDTFMDALVTKTQDWVTFMTAFSPDGSHANTNRLAFAQWCNSQNNRYAYVTCDDDATATNTVPATTSLGYLVDSLGYSGTVPIWVADNTSQALAAFVCGAIASIDFTQTNGRATLAFRRQAGIEPNVTDALSATNLLANGYNFYGDYSTANDDFDWFQNGAISGDYEWIDSYINQVWLNNALQLALMQLLKAVFSIPYNDDGYSLIANAVQDPIDAAVNFGAIRPNVPLSAVQAAEVNQAAGTNVSDILSSRGWYFQVKAATAQVRAARESPPCSLWYMDGQSVQQINLNSVLMQ